jgi:hypothetical protein
MDYAPFRFSQKQHDIVTRLVETVQIVDDVVGVALGGSFARGTATSTSDIDIGLYYLDDAPFKIDDIRTIAEEFNDEPKPVVAGFGGWGKWINGGAWLTIEGQRVDFLYRSINTLQHWINNSKSGDFELDYFQQPSTGFYSYIYLGELSICQVYYEKNKVVSSLKEQVQIYPEKLKSQIVGKFSWQADFTLYHAESAAKRGDIYTLSGCLNRALSAIVQIIYARNEQYFISDKGAIAECMTFEQAPDNLDDLVA